MFEGLWQEINDKYGIGSVEWHSHARSIATLEDFLAECEETAHKGVDSKHAHDLKSGGQG